MTGPLPPFSGDNPTCPKCSNTGALTRYRKRGEHGEDELRTLGPSDRGERLERECMRCDHVWDEALNPAAARPAAPAVRQLQDDLARLAATLAAVLALYPPHLNPDGPAVRPRHVPAASVIRWRDMLEEVRKASAAAGSGRRVG